MRLFRHSSGRIIAFGFDVYARRDAINVIAWSGIDGLDWEPGRRGADVQRMDFALAVEFVHELRDGTVIAYQPGQCIEMKPVADRAVFHFRTLSPEQGALQQKEAA